jgi:transcriptional regulator with XRE-family HTH domain
LDISQIAYSKLEKNETKLTVERLYKLADILETPITDLLDIKAKSIYNQHMQDQSIGHQEVQNLYQENKEKTAQIIALYEARLQDKDKLIEQLHICHSKRGNFSF